MTAPDAPRPGDRAPGFALPDQHGARVSLEGFRGEQAVVLVFFPFAFSGVCTGELQVLRDHHGRFAEAGAAVLGVSCDPMFSLRAFDDRDSLGFPLLSDFWPHGAVATSYGVFDATRGFPRRSTFVIDPTGTVRWAVHQELGEARAVEDYLRALERLGASSS